jgi:hypothetical protein
MFLSVFTNPIPPQGEEYLGAKIILKHLLIIVS